MTTWHIEKRLIKDLKPHPKNPRRLTKDQLLHLEHSLSQFGQAEPIIINLDNMIIGGHQRVNIYKKWKFKELDCSIPDHLLTEDEVEEFLIRLNKNHGEWDYDILGNEFDMFKLVEYGFVPTDFDLDAVNDSEDKQQQQCSKCPTCGKKMKGDKK